MDRNLRKFMETETRSKAQILDNHFVEVQTSDGEIFRIMYNPQNEMYNFLKRNVQLLG